MIVFPFYLCFSFKFRNSLEKRRKNSFYASTRPIRTLDPWNRRNANAVMEKAAILIASTNTPARYKETWRNILNKYKQRIILDAGQLREKHPNCIPVPWMSTINEENKDEDGFLHITYSGEESVWIQ
ncbi:hypothetical protein PRUPE_4G283600 [Prunus persica]|uniref:Uncharacterized protein n=1 Tax=Prunus persica TaxID=3760 RepID=A0A251PSG6_PRUPE|nr:hypothetical protein PRUPE_4G283600 [Prunus persica]